MSNEYIPETEEREQDSPYDYEYDNEEAEYAELMELSQDY